MAVGKPDPISRPPASPPGQARPSPRLHPRPRPRPTDARSKSDKRLRNSSASHHQLNQTTSVQPPLNHVLTRSTTPHEPLSLAPGFRPARSPLSGPAGLPDRGWRRQLPLAQSAQHGRGRLAGRPPQQAQHSNKGSATRPISTDQAGLSPSWPGTCRATFCWAEWCEGRETDGALVVVWSGTESEASSVLQTLHKTAEKPAETLQFNYASEALNNSFFLSLLVSHSLVKFQSNALDLNLVLH